jgi:DNA-binding NarL/FixJ family response regulator
MPTIAVIDDTEKWVLMAEKYVLEMPGYTVIAKLSDGIECVDYCYHHNGLPDIALVDVEMPKMDGVQLTDFLTEHFPSVKVIAVSSHTHKETIEDMFACGAYGYVSKLHNMKNLSKAVTAVTMGNTYLDPILQIESVNRDLLMTEMKLQKQLQNKLKLSPKQKEIIALYTTNASQKEIAAALSVSSKTVENRVKTVSGILNVSNRQQFTTISIRKGFTRLARIFR